MIARIIRTQLEEFIHADTVRSILKKYGYQPNPPGQIPPDRPEPAWKAFINNQFVCAIDFKSVLDLFGNQMFILNIIHHGRPILALRRLRRARGRVEGQRPNVRRTGAIVKGCWDTGMFTQLKQDPLGFNWAGIESQKD